jgi:hypothetical protein
MPFLIILIAILVVATHSWGRQNDEWEATAPEVRAWYRELMQPDNPNVSCCGEADAYWADSFEVLDGKYVAIITDTRDVPDRPTIPPGTRVVVPNHKLKFDRGNPTGHGVIFMNTNATVYCYVVPGGV